MAASGLFARSRRDGPVTGRSSSATKALVAPIIRFITIALASTALLAGCGSGASQTTSGPEVALQRAQFVQLSAGLRSAEGAVQREVSASRGAWPSIAGGLPGSLSPALRAAVGRASASATMLPEPPFLTSAARLTGPAAGIAGIYENYERLAERGWRLTSASIDAIAGTTPAGASFARENSSLYISAIYDAHYDLSLVGKSLADGYSRLGGPAAFGASLPPGAVSALAAAYSIPSVRLVPHPAGASKDG